MLTVRFSQDVNDKVTRDVRHPLRDLFPLFPVFDAGPVHGGLHRRPCSTATRPPRPSAATAAQGPYDMDAWGLQNITTVTVDYDLGGAQEPADRRRRRSRQVERQDDLRLHPAGGLHDAARRSRGPLVNPNPDFPAGYAVFRAVARPEHQLPTAHRQLHHGDQRRDGVHQHAGTATEKSDGSSTDAGVFLTDRLLVTDQLSVIGSYRIDALRRRPGLDLLQQRRPSDPEGQVDPEEPARQPRLRAGRRPDLLPLLGPARRRRRAPRSSAPPRRSPSPPRTSPRKTARSTRPAPRSRIPHTGLAATVAAFDIKKDNALQTDPATGFLQAQSGEKQEVKGVELGLTGKITRTGRSPPATPTWTPRSSSPSRTARSPRPPTGTPTASSARSGVTAAIPVANTVAIGQQVVFVPKHSAIAVHQLRPVRLDRRPLGRRRRHLPEPAVTSATPPAASASPTAAT